MEGGNQVEKWEGGEGNQISGNFIHPCINLISESVNRIRASFVFVLILVNVVMKASLFTGDAIFCHTIQNSCEVTYKHIYTIYSSTLEGIHCHLHPLCEIKTLS